jgi:hypothetical protein
LFTRQWNTLGVGMVEVSMNGVRLLLSRTLVISVCTAGLAAAPAHPPTTAPADAPSPLMQELQTRFDVGDYDGVLRTISHALSQGPKALEGISKHTLLEMRGEAELRLKQTEAAAAAFRDASKATEDPQLSAIDSATELLIRRTRMQKYTPKPPPGQDKQPAPIEVIPADQRKLALRAFFADEWAAVAPKMKAAKDGTSVVVIMDAINAMKSHQLPTLDLAANGNDDQTRQAVTGLKDHAAELLSKGLEKLGKREQEITSAANEIIHQQVMVPGPQGLEPQDLARRRGLRGSERQELDGISRTASQIAEAARALIAGLGDKTAADDLLEQANDIIQRANKAINADYGHA